MNYRYQLLRATSPLRRALALAGLLAATAGAATAQTLNYSAANTANVAGTYTDLGNSGVAIATANFDDANSAVQTLPFGFRYNGGTFTQFVLNTNGYLRLGAVAPGTPYFSNGAQDPTGGPLNGPDTNLILPFNTDLLAGVGGTEYRYATSGAAGSRVTTIQWKNVRDKNRPAAAGGLLVPQQYGNISFQVKLYEATGQIDFAYATATAGPGIPTFSSVTVGLKGSGAAAPQVVTFTKPSATVWAAATPAQGVYPPNTNAFNIRNGVFPDDGRTLRFFPTVARDAAVQTVYAYDQLVVPAGQPVVLRAVVTNVGTAALNNLVVNLAVTGANTVGATQTVTLAPGVSVTVVFPAVAVPATGTNTVTVSVPADDNLANAANNSRSVTMVTNATTTSFITPGQPVVGTSGYGGGGRGRLRGGEGHVCAAPRHRGRERLRERRPQLDHRGAVAVRGGAGPGYRGRAGALAQFCVHSRHREPGA